MHRQPNTHTHTHTHTHRHTHIHTGTLLQPLGSSWGVQVGPRVLCTFSFGAGTPYSLMFFRCCPRRFFTGFYYGNERYQREREDNQKTSRARSLGTGTPFSLMLSRRCCPRPRLFFYWGLLWKCEVLRGKGGEPKDKEAKKWNSLGTGTPFSLMLSRRCCPCLILFVHWGLLWK